MTGNKCMYSCPGIKTQGGMPNATLFCHGVQKKKASLQRSIISAQSFARLSSRWLNLLLDVLLGTEVSLLVGFVEVVACCTDSNSELVKWKCKRRWSLWRVGGATVRGVWCSRRWTSTTVVWRWGPLKRGKEYKWNTVILVTVCELVCELVCMLLPFSVKWLPCGETDTQCWSWTLIWLEPLPRNTSAICKRFTVY